MSDVMHVRQLRNDPFVERFQDVVTAIVAHRPERAEEVLHQIADPATDPFEIGRFVALPRQVAVFARDNYTCRYCGQRTIVPPVLSAVTQAFPSIFRNHPQWREGEASRAFAGFCTTIDHVVPIARGGASSAGNLVTACWSCNAIKLDFLLEELGWSMQPPAGEPWDGLSSLLEDLVRDTEFHENATVNKWIAALGAPEQL